MADERFRQEPEHANILLAVGVGIIALILFAGGVAWSYIIQKTHTRLLLGSAHTTIASPVDAWRMQRGLVFFSHFSVNRVGLGRELQKKRLNSYGWVDREHQRIHIPIDRAVEIYLAGAAPEYQVIRPHAHPGIPWAPGLSGNPEEESIVPPAARGANTRQTGSGPYRRQDSVGPADVSRNAHPTHSEKPGPHGSAGSGADTKPGGAP